MRSLAPDAELTSVRVLGAGYKGGGEIMLRGLAWAIEQGFQVVNMSLSTTRTKYVERLHELADRAYFKRVLLVASAHNMPVESFPWRFASVISVGSHEEADPLTFYYNPTPPVEFFGRGLDLDRRVARRRHAALPPATASPRLTSPASARSSSASTLT